MPCPQAQDAGRTREPALRESSANPVRGVKNRNSPPLPSIRCHCPGVAFTLPALPQRVGCRAGGQASFTSWPGLPPVHRSPAVNC